MSNGSPPKDEKKATKKARQFNIETLIAENLQTAQERQREAIENRQIQIITDNNDNASCDDKKANEETREKFDSIRIRTSNSSDNESNNQRSTNKTAIASSRTRKSDHNDVEQPCSSHSSLLGKTNTASDDDDDEIGPPLPPNFASESTDDQQAKVGDSGVEDDNDDDDEEYVDFGEHGVSVIEMIPTACEATIHHGSKPISAIAFDHQGSKFSTGGFDYAVKLFDFNRMDVSFRPARETMPIECHVINGLSYSANGETLLVASGSAQLKVLDRNGTSWAETVRGDQYLVDLTNTKGHTAAVNACVWHPLIKDEFMTCSDDGTIRLWNIDDYKAVTRCINTQRKVIKTKNANGKRAIPFSCCYSHDGKLIAAGCDDGSLQIWKYGTLYVNTAYLQRNAHKGAITSVQFSFNGKLVLTRGLDDSMKLWTIENKLKEPLLVANDLDNNFPMTDCGFSPSSEIVYTGTSPRDMNTDGRLVFFDVTTLKPIYQISYPKVSCIRVQWHPKINQLLVGLSDGTVKLYYDPTRSARGALQCITRPVRRERKSEVLKGEIILAPLTLDMFQPRGEEGEEKDVTEWRIRKFLRMQNKDVRPQFRKPADVPMSGPSAGGRVAQSGGTLHSYIAQQYGVKRNREMLEDTDVRASILRHAKDAEDDPIYITKAYMKTQPVPIFQEKTTGPEDEEVDEELHPVFKMPKGN